MVRQCPNCGVLVGKLHMRCVWCGFYFCEDCITPEIHHCPQHQREMRSVKTNEYEEVYKVERQHFSHTFYSHYATDEDLEPEKVRVLSSDEEKKEIERNKQFIIEQNHAYQERLKSIFNLVECNNCKKTVEVRRECMWCGLDFCENCLLPEMQHAVIDFLDKLCVICRIRKELLEGGIKK